MALIDNLIAYWKLDETSGDRADSHGSNTLVDNNTVGSATGKINSGADFETSANEFLSIIDNTDLSTGDIDFSMSVWVNIESNSTSGNSRYIIGKHGSSGNFSYGLHLNNQAGTIRFRFLISSNGTALAIVTANNLGAPSTATWYHIVAWHDSVNNLIGITVNDGTPNTSSHTTGCFDNTSPFNLGTINDTASNCFDGIIDEVGFWKKVLTPSEITQLYNSGAGLAYPFSVGSVILPRRRIFLID